jgi:acyl carrier protein
MLQIPLEFQNILRSHLPYADSGEFSATDELAGLGLDSMGVVRLLAAVEDRYDIELPDDILNEETFATVGSLWQALDALLVTGGERLRV